ncbi:MAG TPA: hypothetical protein PKZ27_03100 [Rhodocyclaceae bacterium]|nr:hypothetical protein [Rhodocyclaceae bacterium]
MRAILINPVLQLVTEVEYNGDYHQIYEHIQARMFELVSLEGPDGAEVCVFVDEEGLLNDNPHGWFTIDGYAQPLRGRGLVLGGDDGGNTVGSPLNATQVAAMVQFPSDAEVRQAFKSGGF